MFGVSQLHSLARSRAEFCMRREMSGLDGVAFSIIANDCWAGEVYRLAGREYTTPFIGLFVEAPCYLRILENLDAALASEVVPVARSRYPHRNPAAYPIGRLVTVDAELHFLHYANFDLAEERWRRRAARVNRDALFVKSVGLAEAELAAYRALPFAHKLICAQAPVPGVNTALGHGLSDAVLDFRSSAVRFSVVEWLRGGSGQVPRERLIGRWLRYAGW